MKLKYAIVNIKNRDKKSFVWCILAALYPVNDNTNRVTNYEPYLHKLNLEGLSFPIDLCDLKKFENMNPCSINVYGSKITENVERIYPVRISRSSSTRLINLLIVRRNENGIHFAWIKNLSRLCPYGRNRSYRCKFCLSPFRLATAWQKHEKICSKPNLPTEKVTDV